MMLTIRLFNGTRTRRGVNRSHCAAGQKLAAWALAALLLMHLTSCFIPEDFNVKINLKKDGTYSLRYDGVLTHALIRGAAVAGKQGAKEEEQAKNLVSEILKDKRFKSAKYLGEGRYRVSYLDEGALRADLHFLSRDVKYFSLLLKENKQVELTSFRLDAKDRAALSELKVNVRGTLHVTTDAQVVSHNAQETPKLGGLFGAYTWRLKSAEDPAASMVIQLRLRSN